MLVEARATRWIADEPFPGLVEIELVDSRGHTYRFTEKCSVVDDAGRLRPDSAYPIDIALACRIRTDERFPRIVATLDPRYGDDRELSAALAALVQITYGGLFGGLDSLWSLRDLTSVGRFTSAGGVPLPAPDAFVDSLWADHAWGRPSPEVIRRWRRMAANTEDPGQGRA